MPLIRLSVVIAVLASVAAPSSFGAASYQIYAVPGAVETQVNGINLSGTVVGSFYDSQGDSHGFVGDASGNITTFDVPGVSSGYGQGTFASAINAAGTVVGTYSTSSTTFHGFLRSATGNITTFDVPGLTITSSNQGPSGINNAGKIVGTAGGTGFIGVLGGSFATFTPSGGYTGYVGINSLGQVAGTYADTTLAALHGFSRDTSGNITTFDVPGAMETHGYGTWAYSVNYKGEIAGFWVDTTFAGHGYLRTPSGAITSYDVPGASTFGGSTDINANGAVASTGYDGTTNLFHGFVRYPAGTVVPFDVPHQSEEAIVTGINDYGQVCGYFLETNGILYGFVRTP